ncbi:solute carrier family 25 member 46-like [Gigantopelta aegis]|uniref:solute carrier family 25 member 46-like n=1 Tax=Gigantopelta aegis TaxID=1735272 RepID=UPI001B88A97C|nr:solute carrier family 25 member 46-like [Gigantopelta aegis]
MGTFIMNDTDDTCLMYGNRGAGQDVDRTKDEVNQDPNIDRSRTKSGSQIDQIHKFAGFSIGLSSIFAEQVLSHPCIVLRRQCQVHHNGEWFHLTPFTLFQVMLNMQSHQGVTTLWKGFGSVFVIKGIFMVSETVISEVTPLPKEVSRHSSLKKYGEHLLLKSLSFLVTSPFYAASMIETIQSDIASEKPGVFDTIKEGLTRIMGWGMPQTTRLLPMWKLVLPTLTFRLSHYLITSVAQYTVMSTIRSEQRELRDHSLEEHSADVLNPEATIFDIYFPELLASFTGSLLADVMLFPLETIIHRLYVQGTRTIIDNTDTGLGVIPINTNYEGFTDCFQCIVKEEGIFGLYKGFGALVLQFAIHASLLRIAKYLFEKLSQELNPPKRRPISQSSPTKHQ